jgi:hypothetical protein
MAKCINQKCGLHFNEGATNICPYCQTSLLTNSIITEQVQPPESIEINSSENESNFPAGIYLAEFFILTLSIHLIIYGRFPLGTHELKTEGISSVFLAFAFLAIQLGITEKLTQYKKQKGS